MTEPQPSPRQLPPSQPAPPAREPAFNIPGIVLCFIGLCAAIYGAQTYLLSDEANFELLRTAAFIPIRYSGVFDWEVYGLTSPLTYSLLHGGFAHLAINMVWLAAFGSPLANRIGAARFIAFWAVTSVAAAGLHYVLHPMGQSPLVGASGAISGMMGAAARFGFQMERWSGRSSFLRDPLPIPTVLRMRGVLMFLAVWFVVNLATGLAGSLPGAEGSIAWEAHIGGFLAGFLGISAFAGPSRRPPFMRT